MSIIHIPFYPSDWLAGTLGLSDAEKGVYITLIARMYEMAAPIERNDERLYRVCGSKSKASFVKALEYLIEEGKILSTDEGLFNEKVAKVIKQTTEKSDKAKAAAQSRWDRKANKNNKGGNSDASTKHMPEACHLELKLELDKKESTNVLLQSQPIPVDDTAMAFSAYNSIAERVGWPVIQKVTPARRSAVRARIKDCGGYDAWHEAMQRAEKSPFLSGQKTGTTPASFDWLNAPKNFTKLMEGNYDERTTPNGNGTHGGGGALPHRRQNGADPALEQIARLAGLGAPSGQGGV